MLTCQIAELIQQLLLTVGAVGTLVVVVLLLRSYS